MMETLELNAEEEDYMLESGMDRIREERDRLRGDYMIDWETREEEVDDEEENEDEE